MTIDANMSAIAIALITFVLSPLIQWLIAKDAKKSRAENQVAMVAAVDVVAQKSDTIAASIDGMQDKLLRAKDTAAVAQVEAAGLAGEQRGREQGITSAVVETVKGGNGELARLKEEVHQILKRLETFK